jgi:hypothetical protein
MHACTCMNVHALRHTHIQVHNHASEETDTYSHIDKITLAHTYTKRNTQSQILANARKHTHTNIDT